LAASRKKLSLGFLIVLGELAELADPNSDSELLDRMERLVDELSDSINHDVGVDYLEVARVIAEIIEEMKDKKRL